MVGSALIRKLEEHEDKPTMLTCDLDLRNQAETLRWLYQNQPDMIILAAAKVGGIHANDTRPAEFLYDNLMIESNIIHSAHITGVDKLLFLGSSCIYPKDAPQPITEDSLLTGALEPTNAPYALAKIAGLKLCESYRRQYGSNFISAMPCNLYGPGDRFDALNSHVIPALIMRMDEAREQNAETLTIWGSGTPVREFLYVDDLADALLRLLTTYQGAEPVNIGSGEEITIKGLAHTIASIVGYQGKITFDTSMPDGTMRKLLDSTQIKKTGWKPKTELVTGLKKAYAFYQDLEK